MPGRCGAFPGRRGGRPAIPGRRAHAAGIPSLYDNLDLSFQMFLHNENFFVPLRTRKVRELDYKQVKLNVNKVDSLSYKTISANAATVTKEWVVIDATNEVLGRLASQVAKILRGKNKPSYTPHVDCGDYVIVINAEKVKLTGNKMTDKVYTRHTGYPGGQRFATPADYLAKKPTFLVEKAVKGMLPKTRLGEAILKNLKVYAGPEHPHAAQNPKQIKLNEIK